MRTDWTTPSALRLHATLVVLVVSFALLARWQLARALGGNGLSWAYTFEWPLFAVYAFVVWWRLLHDDRPPGLSGRRSRRAEADDGSVEAARVEYNAYLASLRSDDEEKERRET